MTYDVFEAEAFQGVTILVCPGITNHSECLYIQSLVLQAHNAGHRVAVLNHTGALNSVPLTAPRVFTYGKLVQREDGSYTTYMTSLLVLSSVGSFKKVVQVNFQPCMSH